MTRMLRLKDEAAHLALVERVGARFKSTERLPWVPVRAVVAAVLKQDAAPDFTVQTVATLTDVAVRPKGRFGVAKSGSYASKKEAQRAFVLKLMQDAGEIRNLREHPVYLLIPPQRDAQGKLVERKCEYVADFEYDELQHGEWRKVVEDCKGGDFARTPQYRIKRKLMLFVHKVAVRET